MDSTQVRAKVKEIIANVAGIDRNKIGDHATLSEDLSLDSLSRLEVGVDVDYAFKLKLPDERYQGIDGIDALVELVEQRLAELAAAPEVAAESA
jgi:acyl carrier protein